MIICFKLHQKYSLFQQFVLGQKQNLTGHFSRTCDTRFWPLKNSIRKTSKLFRFPCVQYSTCQVSCWNCCPVSSQWTACVQITVCVLEKAFVLSLRKRLGQLDKRTIYMLYGILVNKNPTFWSESLQHPGMEWRHGAYGFQEKRSPDLWQSISHRWDFCGICKGYFRLRLLPNNLSLYWLSSKRFPGYVYYWSTLIFTEAWNIPS